MRPGQNKRAYRETPRYSYLTLKTPPPTTTVCVLPVPIWPSAKGATVCPASYPARNLAVNGATNCAYTSSCVLFSSYT